MGATFDDLEAILIKKFESLSMRYVKISSIEEIQKISDLWINGIFQPPVTADELNYFGLYYCKVEKNYEDSKKYYLKAIELGNLVAMSNLGAFYEKIEGNYELAKKYYLMGVGRGCPFAMFACALYYGIAEKNYEEAKKYYLMGVEFGDSCAMNNLGVYYENIEGNLKLAKKYYLMSIDGGNVMAMNNLDGLYFRKNKITKSLYYHSLNKDSKFIVERLKTIIDTDIALDKYFYKSLPNLKDCKNLPQILSFFINSYLKQIDVLELAFKYAPGEDGYEAAREDFNQLLSH